MGVASAIRLARRALPPATVGILRRHLLRRRSELPTVEVLVTSHCNLSCRGCNAFAPLSEPYFADPLSFERDIIRLSRLFDRITRIGIVGGEPLLHPEVVHFMRSARAAAPDSEIYMVTNGLLLPRQSPDLWRALHDFRITLNVSDYPIQIDRDGIRSRADEYGVELVFTEPRKQFWNFPIDPRGERDPVRSFTACRERTMCPVIENGVLYLCGRVGVARVLQAATGLSLPVTEDDCVPIHDDVDAFVIQERLARPLAWCRHCAVDDMQVFDWETGRRAIDEWLLA